VNNLSKTFLLKNLFNSDLDKITEFMTAGLLVSRNTKTKLHKLSVTNPATENILKCKSYRTVISTIHLNDSAGDCFCTRA
jgi:hypothetical protein